MNGEQKQNTLTKPGEKVRLRIINGAASTQFWMTFGGGNPTIVSADGLNVEPVAHNKTFIILLAKRMIHCDYSRRRQNGI